MDSPLVEGVLVIEWRVEAVLRHETALELTLVLSPPLFCFGCPPLHVHVVVDIGFLGLLPEVSRQPVGTFELVIVGIVRLSVRPSCLELRGILFPFPFGRGRPAPGRLVLGHVLVPVLVPAPPPTCAAFPLPALLGLGQPRATTKEQKYVQE